MDRIERTKRRFGERSRCQSRRARSSGSRATRIEGLASAVNIKNVQIGESNGHRLTARRIARGTSVSTSSLDTRSALGQERPERETLGLVAYELDERRCVRVEERHGSARAADLVEGAD